MKRKRNESESKNKNLNVKFYVDEEKTNGKQDEDDEEDDDDDKNSKKSKIVKFSKDYGNGKKVAKARVFGYSKKKLLTKKQS